MSKLTDFQNELIASIQNESHTFDMSQFITKDSHGKTATCETACCMAGHIEALRPKLAKKFAKQAIEDCFGYSEAEVPEWVTLDHDVIAAKIWEHETGEMCRLDFYGRKAPCNTNLHYHGEANLKDLTREQAVDHIRGRSKVWPLLEKTDE